MAGITKRVERQAGITNRGMEGGREGWRISRMKALESLYQLQVYI